MPFDFQASLSTFKNVLKIYKVNINLFITILAPDMRHSPQSPTKQVVRQVADIPVKTSVRSSPCHPHYEADATQVPSMDGIQEAYHHPDVLDVRRSVRYNLNVVNIVSLSYSAVSH
jgi:hypothetical protein